MTSTHPDPRLHGKDPSAAPGAAGSYPLLCHLLDTAVVAEEMWSSRVRPALRARIASVLEVTEDDACRVLMLVAALHDIGKINPFFQFQERRGARSEFAADLQAATGLPPTDARLRGRLDAFPWDHPLRRHEFISHRIMSGGWADGSSAVRDPGWLSVVAGGHHGYWREPTADGSWVGHSDGPGERLLDGWTAQQSAFLDLVEEGIGLRVADVPSIAGPGATVPFVCFSGLLTVSDWIASDDVQVQRGKALWVGLAATDEDPYASSAQAKAWMDARRPGFREHMVAALGATSTSSREGLDLAIMGDYAPRPLQLEAQQLSPETDPGLWICMYPTGDGKTEAAMLRGAVDPTEGVFFGLPTLATTDAMERRLTELDARLPGQDRLRIIKSHQFADLTNPGHEPKKSDRSDDDGCDHSNPTWYTTSIRKLVAPNVVGTVDQALVGALASRHITLRLFGLANHHIVLDEVHTYDEYQTELLIELLYWWGATRARVTLLSATLPEQHMRCMVQSYAAGVRGASYESLAAEVADLRAVFPSTVSVSSVDGSHAVTTPLGEVRKPQETLIEVVPCGTRNERIDSHVAWAKKTAAMHPGSPIAVVSNVVADCTQIAAALWSDPAVAATHDVICLHSSLVAGHRQDTEATLLDRAGRSAHTAGIGVGGVRPVIVVGTQVIQASLDFDVDFLASDLAPAPDLLQRLGRAWRFEGSLGDIAFRGGRLGKGTERTFRVVSVVDEDGIPTRAGTHPYLAAVLRRTHASLTEHQLFAGDLVDVFGFSQEWVDAAYDRDPAALLSENEDERREAVGEAVEATRKRVAAAASKAALARPGNRVTTPLLPQPVGRAKGPQWAHLVAMTSTPDDEELMRTRYIEIESTAVILFDSTRTSFYLHPETRQPIYFPQHSAAELASMGTPSALPLFARWRCVVPFSIRDAAEHAVDRTLAGAEWEPRAKLLAATRPLDLKYLHEARYDPAAGLMKRK